MSNDKPRVWTITGIYSLVEGPTTEGTVLVIEKSAYDAVVSKLNDAIIALEEISDIPHDGDIKAFIAEECLERIMTNKEPQR